MASQIIIAKFGKVIFLLLTGFIVSIGFTWDAFAAPVLVTPFDSDYSITDLGEVPGVPVRYGGLTIKYDDANTLLIGGEANSANGALYAITVVRDEGGHITGFDGTATLFAEAAQNDGGVTYGPSNVLFLARYPNRAIGQILPGSTATDKIVDLSAQVSASGPGGLMFVPPGFPAAGALKLVTWPSGNFYTLEIASDGSGTYDVNNVIDESLVLSGGPEGFVYIGPDNPQINANSMLVSEYTASKVALYDIDESGNPVISTRRDFVTGLNGAEGAYVDPLSGDFLFSTYNATARVIAVKGFVTPTSASPDQFSFTSVDPVEPGVSVDADPINVSGIATSIPVTISGGQYAVNGGIFTGSAGLVNNGDVIIVRVVSSTSPGGIVTATLTLGSGANAVSSTFTVKTVGTTAASSSSGGGGWAIQLILALLAVWIYRIRKFGWLRKLR